MMGFYIEGKLSSTAPHTTNFKMDFANNNGNLIGNSAFAKKAN